MQPLTDSKQCDLFLRENCYDDNVSLTEQEEVYCIYLDNQGRRLFHKRICVCRYSETMIDFRAIIRHALNVQSNHVILAHNHPCGDHRPSDGDKTETEKLIKFLALADIELEDHIILTENKYFSFKDSGLIEQMKKAG